MSHSSSNSQKEGCYPLLYGCSALHRLRCVPARSYAAPAGCWRSPFRLSIPAPSFSYVVPVFYAIPERSDFLLAFRAASDNGRGGKDSSKRQAALPDDLSISCLSTVLPGVFDNNNNSSDDSNNRISNLSMKVSLFGAAVWIIIAQTVDFCLRNFFVCVCGLFAIYRVSIVSLHVCERV